MEKEKEIRVVAVAMHKFIRHHYTEYIDGLSLGKLISLPTNRVAAAATGQSARATKLLCVLARPTTCCSLMELCLAVSLLATQGSELLMQPIGFQLTV